MAFTGEQKTQFRHALGYPQVYLASNPRLESAIQRVELDADASALAVSLLAELATAKADYLAAIKTAGVRTLDKDDVGFFENNAAIKGKAMIGRSVVGELSILFGTPIVNDIFSGRGYEGDGWKLDNRRVKLAGIS